jgi:hypothetical protein
MSLLEFRRRQHPLPLEPAPETPVLDDIPFTTPDPAEPFVAEAWLPPDMEPITDHQTDLPRIAKNARLIVQIERRLPMIPTEHHLYNADARALDFISPASVHLVLTSPPYWTLKEYREHPDQLGSIANYDAFLLELRCERAIFHIGS